MPTYFSVRISIPLWDFYLQTVQLQHYPLEKCVISTYSSSQLVLSVRHCHGALLRCWGFYLWPCFRVLLGALSP